MAEWPRSGPYLRALAEWGFDSGLATRFAILGRNLFASPGARGTFLYYCGAVFIFLSLFSRNWESYVSSVPRGLPGAHFYHLTFGFTVYHSFCPSGHGTDPGALILLGLFGSPFITLSAQWLCPSGTTKSVASVVWLSRSWRDPAATNTYQSRL
jgi:hypothetical protein